MVLTIAPYLSDSKYKDNPTAALEGSMKTLWCPSTKAPKEPYPTAGFGESKHRWRFHVTGLEGEGSYGLNTWVGGMDIDMQVFYGYFKPGQAIKCSLRNSQARSDTPVFADSWWMEGIPMDPDQSAFFIPQNVPPYTDDPEYVGGDYVTDDYGMRRFCFDRHNMTINISFADGSVDKVKLEKLWSLKWNKSFKTIDNVDIK